MCVVRAVGGSAGEAVVDRFGRPGGITRGRHTGYTVENEPYRLFSSTNPKFNTLPDQSSKFLSRRSRRSTEDKTS